MRRHVVHDRSRVWGSVSLVCCTVAVAACGSSGNPGTGTHSGGVPAGIRFAECMRTHGVPKFPDPGSTHEIPILRSPAFQSALKSCQRLVGGGVSPGPPSPRARARLLEIAECMRRRGISDFPDPRGGSPPATLTGYSLILGTAGYFLALPDSINPGSPAFKQAASVCKFGPRLG
jgi:hypothetical protein